MYSILLPLVATVSLAPTADTASEPLPPAYQPCAGTVPVFNPEGCPPPALVVEPVEPPGEAPCRDRIRQVRAASGQPRLEKLPVSSEHPPIIAAVDRRIGDCPVMQMHRDAGDVRPLPSRPQHGARLLHKAD